MARSMTAMRCNGGGTFGGAGLSRRFAGGGLLGGAGLSGVLRVLAFAFITTTAFCFLGTSAVT